MYDVRFSMYDLDFSAPAARRGRTGRVVPVSQLSTYDLNASALRAGLPSQRAAEFLK